MDYDGVEYSVRKGLGQNVWIVLIHYPGRAPTAIKLTGRRDQADALARLRIDNWLKRNGVRGSA